MGQPRRFGCLIEVVQTVVLTAAIFFGVQAFVAQPFEIRQQSMQPTLQPAQYVLVDKLTPRWDDYSAGDVVVFVPPPGWGPVEQPYIKRVIGIAGDAIEIRDDGYVYRNGARLDEPYVQPTADGDPEPTIGNAGTRWTIADGELFVMGDHRSNSRDSRAGGPIPVERVIGRAWLRYWPFDALGILPTPDLDPVDAGR
jgi:signal peptidase I